MVNITALMNVLPISGLEPGWVAYVGGFVQVPKDQEWRYSLTLLEPPAGQQVPYISPLEALPILLRTQGHAEEVAQALSQDFMSKMRASIEAHRWVNFINLYEPESPDCISVADFVDWIRPEAVVSPEIMDFMDQVTEVTVTTPMFHGPDNWKSPWSLKNLPSLPPPKAMIEFVPGAPWYDEDWDADNNPFLLWRESIRPVAQALEMALGEPVYYFSELDDDLDDDDVHRFLVLHWCCTYKPDSAYVKYLLEVTGAPDVEELKAALIDPANYTQPFKMNSAFHGLEPLSCRFEYLPPTLHKTVAVVFMTPEARFVAESVLAERIGMHVCIIAPKSLLTDEWVNQATRYCRDWVARYVYDNVLDDPIDTLALVDELCVIANESKPGRGFDLKLAEDVEDLLFMALELGINSKYFDIDRMRLGNPEDCLQSNGVPERVSLRNSRKNAFTEKLTEIRIISEFGSSGLWSSDGKMLPYDLLDLPFPLIRRIAAWQRDFDDTVTPPDNGDDAWWDRHHKEEQEIARALQAAVGSAITVSVWSEGKWLPILGFAAESESQGAF